MSSLGMDGVLSWAQAFHVARTCAPPLPVVQARLDEAEGSILGQPLVTLQDDPPHDAAAMNGYAICGEGPWTIAYSADPESPLRPHQAAIMRAGDLVPRHADAILSIIDSDSERRANGDVVVVARDALTGIPDERVRPLLGAGIVRRGDRSSAGHVLLETGGTITASVLAMAAAAGHDTVPVVRPPVVGTLVLGSSLLAHGLPRGGRVRDALGMSVPAFVGRLGARGNPAVRAPDAEELLLEEIDDAAVDVLITTGSTAPDPANHVRRVLRDLGARWLIDGVACEPGEQMLLARLPDGRFIVGLPGDPRSALAALVTIAAPLIGALRGAGAPELPVAVLAQESVPPQFADDTRLQPVRLEPAADRGPDGAPVPVARPIDDHGPARLQAWAQADAIAVVPPGSGARGDLVQLVPSP